MAIYTRNELDRKAVEYINERIADGYISSFNECNKSRRNSFVILEKKDGKYIVWHEFIHYGIDSEGNYKFNAEVHLNGKRQNKFSWKYLAAGNNSFSD